MDWQTFDLPDADVRLAQFCEAGEAERWYARLHAEIPWERHRLRLFGREVDSPRLSCWIGDADATYVYSRVRYVPRAWPDALLRIRERLRAQCGIEFNGVLANRYRDGSDGMGWHSDDEPEIDAGVPIASLSLGATRRFTLRHRADPALRSAIELEHGSLLLMAGGMQRHWQHALPKTTRAIGPRINLTFRRIAPSTDR